jgi:phosphate transport system substrate-binding protein
LLLSPAAAFKLELRGAGSTLAAPLYEKWIDVFEKTHPNTLSYEAVGSGEGVARFSADSVEFGASDVPLSPAEAAKITRGVIEVPATAGMVVLAYNLPGVSSQLRLPQDVYVDIFMGRIQSWDDPRIRAANPGVSLPSRNIAVVVRQDSSGTTFAFTNHLAAVSKRWTSEGLGVGKLIEWPRVAMIARGNEGVASRIKISEGSIGYVEFGFARRLGLPIALLQNKSGEFIAPTEETGTAALAASASNRLDALSASLANPTGPQAYPIVTYSWLLLYEDYPEQEAQAISSFVGFGLSAGQTIAANLGYLALPPAVADVGKRALSRLK